MLWLIDADCCLQPGHQGANNKKAEKRMLQVVTKAVPFTFWVNMVFQSA